MMKTDGPIIVIASVASSQPPNWRITAINERTSNGFAHLLRRTRPSVPRAPAKTPIANRPVTHTDEPSINDRSDSLISALLGSAPTFMRYITTPNNSHPRPSSATIQNHVGGLTSRTSVISPALD